MKRFGVGIIEALLCVALPFCLVACGEEAPASNPPPPAPAATGTDDGLPASAAPTPTEPTEPTVEETSTRRVFDEGRYAIEFPAEFDFTSQPSSGSVKHSFSVLHEGSSYGLSYFVHEEPAADVAEAGYLRFETRRFVESQSGREHHSREVQLRDGRPALSSQFTARSTRRELHHNLVVWVADRTMFFLHVTHANAFSERAVSMAQTFEVLGTREDVVKEEEAEEAPESHGDLMEGLQQRLAEAPTPTAEDIASAPRSTRPGRPSIAHSCNQIPLMGHCYETASTTTGAGFFNTAERCSAPHTFSTDPCPTAGRTGSCVLSGTYMDLPPYAQVVHYYRGASGESICTSWGGSYRPSEPRVVPRNAPR